MGEERKHSDAVGQDTASGFSEPGPGLRLGKGILSPPGPAVSEVKVHQRSQSSSGICSELTVCSEPKLLAVALVCDTSVH